MVISLMLLASGSSARSLISVATGRNSICATAAKAPRGLSSTRTAFLLPSPSSQARRFKGTGSSNINGPTTSSSGNPPPLSSKSTATAQSPATRAGDAAKQQAQPGQVDAHGQTQVVKNFSSSSATTNPAAENAEGAINNISTMDWNSYFILRRTRRNYERTFMVPCALLTTLGAGYYFAQQDFDPTPIFGMDQVFVYAAGTIAAGIVGLAIGPVVGNIVFRATNSKSKPLLDSMDSEFRKHIVKNRVDFRTNSPRNPVFDYEGEKIKSVSDYRKWLRKQREHRRKATFFV